MAYQEIKLYQAGTFVAGNRLLDPDQRSVQARMGRSNTLTSGHRAAPWTPGGRGVNARG